MNKLRKIIVAVVAISGATYLSIYVVLAAKGEYRELEDQHSLAWAVWYPAACSTEGSWRGLKRYYLSDVGYIFLPCIYLDRKLFHKGCLTVSAQGDGFRLARITVDGKRIEKISSPYSPLR